MALGRKGARRIVLDGTAYRWLFDAGRPTFRAWPGHRARTRSSTRRTLGITLVVTTSQPHSSNWIGREAEAVLPSDVARAITDRNGLPLSLGISGANTHDSLGLQPPVRGAPAIRSRRGPRRRRPAKLHADKDYDYDHLGKGSASAASATASPAKASSPPTRLGRHRGVVDRTVSWLAGYRRLHRRYEHKAEHFLGLRRHSRSLIIYRRWSTATAS